MRCERAKINNIARAGMDMRFQPEISLEKHEDVGYSLALVDYDAQTIFLGTEVHPDDVEARTLTPCPCVSSLPPVAPGPWPSSSCERVSVRVCG